MQKCTDDVKTWMTVNKLKLNDDKTEAMIVSSSRKSRKSLPPSMSKTLVLLLLVTWPWKLTSPIWYVQPILNLTKLAPPAVRLLQFCPVWLSSASLKQIAESSEQRCSPFPESSQNWPHLSSSGFSPMAAHSFRNTVQTRFSVLYRSCLLDWTPKSLQTNDQLRSFSDTSIHCLNSVCTHSLDQISFSYAAPSL